MESCFRWMNPKLLPLEAANALNGLDGLLTPAFQRFHYKGNEGDTSRPTGPSMGGYLPLLPHPQSMCWSGGSSGECLLLYGRYDMVQGCRLTSLPVRELGKKTSSDFAAKKTVSRAESCQWILSPFLPQPTWWS